MENLITPSEKSIDTLIEMINLALDHNYKLIKISDHIQFGELNAFSGFEKKFNEEVYVSLIAVRQTCLYSTSNSNALAIQERESIVIHVSKDRSLIIHSPQIDSRCIVIIYSSSFIDRLCIEDRKFLKLIEAYKRHSILDDSIYPLTLELLHNSMPEYLRNIQQKSKVLEIFFKQLTHISTHQAENIFNLKKVEMKKAEDARQLIDSDVSNSYTIPELARIIGTNEQYLKKHFKQLYGTTIHNYILKNKMQHAKELLITSELKIAAIANKIGYKHATHFTTAFKKYFGFLPNSMRFNWIAYLSPYYLEFLCII